MPTVSTNSWHFKLMDKAAMDPWNKSNLCSYFWALVFTLIMVLFLAAGALVFLFGIGCAYVAYCMCLHNEPVLTFQCSLMAMVLAYTVIRIRNHRRKVYSKNVVIEYIMSAGERRDLNRALAKTDKVLSFYKSRRFGENETEVAHDKIMQKLYEAVNLLEFCVHARKDEKVEVFVGC